MIEWTEDPQTDWQLFFVVDTDSYAGSFERPMLTAATGILAEYATAACKKLATTYNGPDFFELDVVGTVLNDPGDDGYHRTHVEICVSPYWSGDDKGEIWWVTPDRPMQYGAYYSVRIPLNRELTADELDGIKQRVLDFAAAGTPPNDRGYQSVRPFKVEGFRYQRECKRRQSHSI